MPAVTVSRPRVMLLVLVASALAAFAACADDDAPTPAPLEVDAGTVDAPVFDGVSAEDVMPVDLDPRCVPRADASPLPTFPSRRFDGDACTGADIQAMVECLFIPDLSDLTCPFYDDASTSCQECIIAPADAGVHGALIREGPVVRTNVGGCIDNMLGTQASILRCGERFEQARACASGACAHCLTEGASINDYETCREAALVGICLAKAQATQECMALLDPDGAAETCVLSDEFTDQAKRMVTLFCTRGAPDAGDGAD